MSGEVKFWRCDCGAEKKPFRDVSYVCNHCGTAPCEPVKSAAALTNSQEEDGA